MKIVFATATQLAQMIRNKEVSAVEVLDAYLKQIDKHNSKVNAIATLDAEEARKKATEADEALAKGEHWGILHGVPVTIKDTLETAGIQTTAGYLPLKDYVPTEDATVVARLKAAGAIVFAKTNTPILAGDYQTSNPIFGRTNNPWDLNRTPGGSSGGSASALAAGFSPLDVGSDIAGSIRHPAHYCGVYGLMPTDRRISLAGHIPPLPGQTNFIRHMLRVGALARSVADLELCFDLIAGTDDKQPDIPPVSITTPAAKKLSELKIAWTYGCDLLPIDKDTRFCIQSLINNLSNAGCFLEESQPTNLDWEETLSDYSSLAFYELFASTSSFTNLFRGFLLGLTTEFMARTQTHFKSGTPLSRKANLIFPPTVAKYKAVLEQRDRITSMMDRFLESWDAWLCPVSMSPAFTHRAPNQSIKVDGVKFPYLLACGGYTMPLNFTGHPVVVIPIGQSAKGLPIGIQIVGKRWQEIELLAVSKEIDTIADGFQHPSSY